MLAAVGTESKRTDLRLVRLLGSANRELLRGSPEGHDRKISPPGMEVKSEVEPDAGTPSDKTLR